MATNKTTIITFNNTSTTDSLTFPVRKDITYKNLSDILLYVKIPYLVYKNPEYIDTDINNNTINRIEQVVLWDGVNANSRNVYTNERIRGGGFSLPLTSYDNSSKINGYYSIFDTDSNPLASNTAWMQNFRIYTNSNPLTNIPELYFVFRFKINNMSIFYLPSIEIHLKEDIYNTNTSDKDGSIIDYIKSDFVQLEYIPINSDCDIIRQEVTLGGSGYKFPTNINII